ncbi:MAG: flagellar hook-associated protein FlgK [Planctomycetaceae bacterium]
MTHIDVGISAMRAAQVGLATIANNIANADTDGYHRQRVDLVDRRSIQNQHLWLGGGVDVASITRLRNATVEHALTANLSGKAAAEASLQALSRIEAALTPGPGSIDSLVTDFFDQVEQLALNPSDSVLRREIVATASQLASAINGVTQAFSNAGSASAQEIKETVDKVNSLAENISNLNHSIRIAEARAENPNSLYDQRERLINELAAYVDIDSRSVINGGDPLVAAGGALIVGNARSIISVQETADGRLLLASSTGQKGIEVRSGKLGGLLESMHAVDLGIQADFQEWATSLIREIDTIQATGLSLTGPVRSITGQRSVADINAPLREAGTAFGVESGELSLTVTDASGQRQTHVISVDVTTESLTDFAAKLNAVANVNASVNASTGRLSIHTNPGYAIDFAGRADSAPISSAITGTAVPTLSGRFTGSTNGTWTAEVISGGEVGVTPDVFLQVTDSVSGQVIGQFNVGLGYPANQVIQIGEGINVAFGPGTLNAGDTFDVQVTGTPDETGLLASLGMQTLFIGGDLSHVAVHPDILASPGAFAAAHSSITGDGQQLDRFISLRSKTVGAAGFETFEERLSSIVGSSGILVTTQQQEIDQRDLRIVELENARDAVSGVDPNEELLQMLQFQRAFQAASRFVTSMDESLDELMRLVG